MSRRVPEAAPLVGVLLAFAFGLYGLFFSANHLATVLVCILLLYPFVAFGVVRSDTPEEVFLPDAVLAAAFLGSASTFLYGIATGDALFGSLVAAVIAAPPIIYHARYGASVNPLGPNVSLVVGLLATGGLLVYGAVDDLLVGALAATIVGLTTVDYRRQRGGRFDRPTRTAVLLACLGGGTAVFGGLTLAGRPTEGLAAGGVLVAIGAFVAFDAELEPRSTR